jgi:Domain of unknown function (DUF6468)
MMSEMIASMLLDGSVAILLSITIYYCIKLNKRVQLLQDSKSELATLIQQFDESTKQATVSIHEIHKASKKINENIQLKLDKANYLADDLAFMIERANKTADRIEQQISTGRSTTSPNTTRATADIRPEARRTVDPTPATAPIERADSVTRTRDRTTLRPSESRPAAQANAAKERETVKTNSGIEAMMERISELRSGHQQTARTQRPMARLRTSSEEDLMRAMKDKKE